MTDQPLDIPTARMILLELAVRLRPHATTVRRRVALVLLLLTRWVLRR